MTPSKTLLFFCVSFVGGIATSSILKIPHIFLWGILVLGVVLILLNFVISNSVKHRLVIFGFCILFFALGIGRFQTSQLGVENDVISKLNDSNKSVVLLGQIIDEPDVRQSYQNLRVKVDKTNSIILVSANLRFKFNYLDKVKIKGELKTPEIFVSSLGTDFDYKKYLSKEGIYSIMNFPSVEIVSKVHQYNATSFLYEKVLFLKDKLKNSIDENFVSPQNAVLRGIILGDNKNMSKDLRSKFSSSGLIHLTAVSGVHIVILSSILMSILLFLGLWRHQAFYFSLIFLWLYIIMVGLPPSGVRAAIMGSIFLTAEFFGRQNTSSRTIVLAGALMLLQNPFLLLYDVGFELSFLASMGIIHFKPIMDSFLRFTKKVKTNSKIATILYGRLNYLKDIILVTISAQIFTLPIIIYNFGMMSLVSPITNLLILPFIPVLMFFGFLSAFVGIFSQFIGWVFAVPNYAIIFYILKVLDIFYQPWATITLNSFSIGWFLIYYAILFTLVVFLKSKIKKSI